MAGPVSTALSPPGILLQSAVSLSLKAPCKTQQTVIFSPNPACKLIIRFNVLFNSPFGVLFNIPSRYSFTIGRASRSGVYEMILATSKSLSLRLSYLRVMFSTILNQGHCVTTTRLSHSRVTGVGFHLFSDTLISERYNQINPGIYDES